MTDGRARISCSKWRRNKFKTPGARTTTARRTSRPITAVGSGRHSRFATAAQKKPQPTGRSSGQTFDASVVVVVVDLTNSSTMIRLVEGNRLRTTACTAYRMRPATTTMTMATDRRGTGRRRLADQAPDSDHLPSRENKVAWQGTQEKLAPVNDGPISRRKNPLASCSPRTRTM
uniref:Uncharacterized protein n=1 Tax=Plectus sambesii TaxID=2011161 RepID=A0A914W4Z4_9BILA